MCDPKGVFEILYEKRAKIKYQDELLAAEKEAREKKIGVWSR